MKKHPQFILAMDAHFFSGSDHFEKPLTKFPFDNFIAWPQTQSALCLKEREVLENDPTYRQVLPYIVLRRLALDGRPEYFCYQRMKGVGESRLLGKLSIGLGGHIDLTDVKTQKTPGQGPTSIIDLPATLGTAIDRELGEEVDGIGVGGSDSHPANLFIVHPEGVNAVHVGIVYFVDVSYTQSLQIMTIEKELEGKGWHPADALAKMGDFEVWSQLLIEHFNTTTGD